MVAWLERCKALCKRTGRTTWIVLMAVAGMLLIFLSGIGGGEAEEISQEPMQTGSQQTEDAYRMVAEQ